MDNDGSPKSKTVCGGRGGETTASADISRPCIVTFALRASANLFHFCTGLVGGTRPLLCGRGQLFSLFGVSVVDTFQGAGLRNAEGRVRRRSRGVAGQCLFGLGKQSKLSIEANSKKGMGKVGEHGTGEMRLDGMGLKAPGWSQEAWLCWQGILC